MTKDVGKNQTDVTVYDDLLIDDSDVAAIVMRQTMKPVEGDGAVIFPPTYADIGYNIDPIQGSNSLKNVCLIDSVGSQANRMEPIFKKEKYKCLVPQTVIEVLKKSIKAGDKGDQISNIHLLDAGHRIADAVVRFSNAAPHIAEAFEAIKKGNASLLAKLAPTSLVFGCWDSRESGVKLQRIVRATIRATNVFELKRRAQYVATIKHYEETGVDKTLLEKKDGGKTRGAKNGFYDIPAPVAAGGVILDEDSKILKEAVLSLTALRALNGDEPGCTLKLRRYIFGLALVALTARQDPLLRMGCELIADINTPPTWEKVKCNGERDTFNVSHENAFDFAKEAAQEFAVGETKKFCFKPEVANKFLKNDKDNNE